jgi:hypothetical protein
MATSLVIDDKEAIFATTSVAQETSLVAVALEGGQPRTLASGRFSLGGLVADAKNVYFTDPEAGTISRVPREGGAPAVLAKDPGGPRELGLLGGSLVWLSSTAGKVQRVPVTGGTPTQVATGQRAPKGLIVSGGVAYWADPVYGTIARAAEGGHEPLASEERDIGGIAVDPSGVYFTRIGQGAVARVVKDDAPRVLVQGEPQPLTIATDETWVYFGVTGALKKIKKSGGKPETVCEGQGIVSAIVPRKTELCWSTLGTPEDDYRDGRVMCAPKR